MWLSRLAALIAVPLLGTVVPFAAADDFRVESKLYSGDSDEPYCESTTLFHSGLVYDYLSLPRRTTIFDSRTGRYVLLDVDGRRKAEISPETLQQFSEELRARIAVSKKPLLRFLAEPSFEQQFDPQRNELTLASPLVTYAVLAEPAKTADCAAQYAEFCDGFARLNCLLNQGSLPPFGRLQLNAALRERQLLPREVRLVVTRGLLPLQKLRLRSEHVAAMLLSTSDLERINQTAREVVEFRLVSLNEFRQP